MKCLEVNFRQCTYCLQNLRIACIAYSFSPLHEMPDIFRHFMKCLTSRIACNISKFVSVGFAGLPQPLADAFKLLAKEIAKPSIANRLPYFIAPIERFFYFFFSITICHPHCCSFGLGFLLKILHVCVCACARVCVCVVLIIIIDRFYIALFSALEQTHCARI